MTAGGAARKGLAALIVGSGDKSADGGGEKLLSAADPDGEAVAAADPNATPTSDPYVELASEAIEAFQAGDANALAAVLRAVRGLPVE